MNIKFVDLKKNYLSIKQEIDQEYNELFETCNFIQGDKVTIFENNFANYLDIKYFIGCGNGTDALEIAVKSLDFKDEDEIIVQGNTYIASCLGVTNNNIKLVLCDIDRDTFMININELEKCITSKTKAIILVHLYGLMPDMDKILDLCKKYRLYLIEDCAQAHGATFNNRKAGTFGDIACFSFYPGKNLGAYGDGGGIGTNSNILNDKIRKLINLGCKVKYNHELLGRNSRLDTLQASFLNIKLKYLDKWNKARRLNASIYDKELSDLEFIDVPIINDKCIPVYHLYVIRTQYRDELKKYLDDKNIPTLIHYPISISETNAIKNTNNINNINNVSNCIISSNEILSLPMYPELEESEIKYICSYIKQFFLEKNLLVLQKIETINKPGILNYINNINFNIKRLFYIDNFKCLDNNKRGFHANTNFNEILLVLQGTINIKLISKDKDYSVSLKTTEINKKLSKNDIFYIPKENWIEYEILEQNSEIIVFVDMNLQESKCIYNFNEFLNLCN